MPIRERRAETRAPGPARAPQGSIDRAADTSGAQALGSSITNYALIIEQSRQETEHNDARLSLTEGLGAINNDLAQDTDYATINDRYAKRLDDLKTSVLGQAETPRINSAMTLEFARGRVAAEARINKHQQGLEGNHARATLTRTLLKTAEVIPNAGNDAEAVETYNRANAAIDSMVTAGHITEEDAVKFRVDLDDKVSTALVLGAINDDAAGAAKTLAENEGAFGLDEVDRQRYLAVAARKAGEQQRGATTILNKQLTTAENLLNTGKAVNPEQLQQLLAATEGTPQGTRLRGAVQASQNLGVFAAVPPAERAAHIAKLKAQGIDLNNATNDKAKISALEDIDKAQMVILTKDVKTARTALVAGQTVDPEQLARLRHKVRGSDLGLQLEAAINAKETWAEFPQATPKQREAFINGKIQEGLDLQSVTIGRAELDALEAIHANAQKAMQKDPVAYAIEQDFDRASPLNLGDPESMQNRMAVVQELIGQHGSATRIFTNAEQKQFKEAANNGSIDEQLSFVVSVIDGFGPGAEVAFREIDGLDPVVHQAGRLVLETGESDIAAIILSGRKAMKAGDELHAPKAETLTIFEATLDGVLGLEPGRRERTIEAVKAYYADQAPGRVTAEETDKQSKLLTEAVQKVLGQRKINGVTYGGIQEVNGARVRLPSTLDSDAVETMFRNATPAHWKAGSLSGGDPHEGETVILPEGAVLNWVSGTIYRVGVPSNRGGVEYLQDPSVDNGLFYVDVTAMAKAFDKNPPANLKSKAGWTNLFGLLD